MANAASGMAVDDECKLKFHELKAKRSYRFITFKIEDQQVVVDKYGSPEESYEDFTNSLPADECRYAVFDFDFTTDENCQKSKIFFIAWSPKNLNSWIAGEPQHMEQHNNRYNTRRVQLNDSKPRFDIPPADAEPHPSEALFETLEPLMGVKARRLASFDRDYRGDYLDVSSNPYILRILDKQGDRQVLFADKVLKFTSTGKMKRRFLIVTDFALFVIDPESYSLKRRITLSAVEKLYLSKLSDNFFAIVIPTEYDILMASTRKTEIVTVLVDAAKNTSNFELDVIFKNRFEYNPAADLVKEVHFEEVEGGVKTRILRKLEEY